MEKREPSYTVDGNVNWCSHYGKLKIELPHDPAIPLLRHIDLIILALQQNGFSQIMLWYDTVPLTSIKSHVKQQPNESHCYIYGVRDLSHYTTSTVSVDAWVNFLASLPRIIHPLYH